MAAPLAVVACGSGGDEPTPCDPKIERGVRISTHGEPASVCVGETLPLYADRWACEVNEDVTADVVWSTDRPEIAVVPTPGTLVGVGPGEVLVAVRDADQAATISVLVRDCAGDAGVDAGGADASDAADATDAADASDAADTGASDAADTDASDAEDAPSD